jgi:uncharacterized membrane protein
MADPKPFPWRTLALVLAGVLILSVTAMAGAFVGGVRLDRPGDFAGHRGLAGFAREQSQERRPFAGLSPEERRAMRERIGEAWRAAEPYRQASWAARLEVMRVAGADPYDITAMRTALSQMRDADSAGNAAVHNALAEVMAGLTAEQREALLAANARLRGRWGERGGGRPGPPEERPREASGPGP